MQRTDLERKLICQNLKLRQSTARHVRDHMKIAEENKKLKWQLQDSSCFAKDCCVCNREHVAMLPLPCNHATCSLCLVKWLKTNPQATCPLCRQPLNMTIEFIVDKMVEIAQEAAQVVEILRTAI